MQYFPLRAVAARILTALALLLAGTVPALATWSVVITDAATGEVAIGSATCVTNIDLKREASVVVVGQGAGAAQSFVEPTGRNRGIIFDELRAGTDPAQILNILEAQDGGHQSRQYGIADTRGRAASFSGSQNGAFAGDLTGSDGTISYAVQGNVITGQAVLDQAEAAILQGGDLPTRLMRSMLAARAQGGDGRCSCSPGAPDGCGAPPPDFDKSADVGYMLVTRVGDADGTCNSNGCATGDYYMDLNVAFQNGNDPDPVFTLFQEFNAFRQSQINRPDHYTSRVIPLNPTLPADGTSTTPLIIVLRDFRGGRVVKPSLSVEVDLAPDSEVGVDIPDVVIPAGNGIFFTTLRANTQVGTARLTVTARDDEGVVQLAPATEIQIVPVR
jgi:hypothetical protein